MRIHANTDIIRIQTGMKPISVTSLNWHVFCVYGICIRVYFVCIRMYSHVLLPCYTNGFHPRWNSLLVGICM